MVLHIGTHKTGTTSFQHALHARTAALAATGHALFHSELTDVRSWSHELPLLAVRASLTIPLRRRFPDSALPSMQGHMREWVVEQAQSSAPTLVCSHEALSLIRSEREAEVVAELMHGRQIEVVVVLREPNSFMESWRAQLSRMGYATESRYPDSLMYTAPGTWLTRWDVLVDAYASVLGRDSITVLDYGSAVARDGNVLPSLWRACSLPESLLPDPRQRWLNVTRGAPSSP